ncbi:anti-sigma regulatory factor [Oscillatoria sp. CS-180]|uniref:ATP-binding protein n=1 Tax=Oscillatoria sp. CS-180 TaxID=3021720 RepID=UPI00232F1B22|nr:anti-sigma regulatory factor [Oscillatoria sp. CS-180]MDB9528230.1 anti-sigma regulatory factor [Oscillatoria sp. CS-180]
MSSELQVPSDLKFISIIEDWLLGCLRLELAEWPDWPKWENRLRLVMVEAYSNVVRHAHQDKPHIPVLLKLDLHPDFLRLEVWDQGPGFDIDSYLPPTPDAQQEGGYGWLILNRLMDKVDYQAAARGNMNCLRLQVNLPTDLTRLSTSV